MDNLSLYRKYRPHNFDHLVGQDHVRTTLINAFKNGNTAHAYLFTGPRGTGKTSTARIVAKAINCENLKDGFDPCDECDLCKDIAQGRLIDLIEIDAASNRGIDEVRDLKEKINFAPTRAKNKVYIIDEVHMMTKEAFNALLKTLEEPPSHVYFILATTEVHKIPETIISRCQRFDFKRINEKVLMTRLAFICQKEQVEAEDKALEAIAKYVEGGLRDAINLLEQLTVDKQIKFDHVKEILGLSAISLLEEFYKSLQSQEITRALSIVSETYAQGLDLRQFTHEFIDILRNKMLENVNSGNLNEALNLSKMIGIFQEAQQNLDSSIPQLPLEIAVVRATVQEGPVAQTVRQEVPVVTSVGAPAAAPIAAPIAAPTAEARPVERAVAPAVEVAQQEPIRDHQSLANTGDLSILMMRENWPRVTERVTLPSLRISLKDAHLEAIDGNNLILKFSTQFHKDKVIESHNSSELESILKDVFGKNLKLVVGMKELEIKENKLEEAMGIFGGEVLS